MKKPKIKRVYVGKWRFEESSEYDDGRLEIYTNGAIILRCVIKRENLNSRVSRLKCIRGIADELHVELIDLEEASIEPYNNSLSQFLVNLKVRYALISEYPAGLYPASPDSINLTSKFYSYWVDKRHIDDDIISRDAYHEDNFRSYECYIPLHGIHVNLSSSFVRSRNPVKAEIKKVSSVGFRFENKPTIFEMIDTSEKFGEFLYLITGYRVYPKFDLYSTKENFDRASLITWTGREKLTAKNFYGFFGLRYSDMDHVFPQMFGNWLTKYADLKHLVDLQNSILWRDGVAIRDAFIVFCQLIEGWQDTQESKLHIKESEYRAYRKETEKFIDNLHIDEKVKSNMKNGIIASYKFSFSDKLADFVSDEIYSLLGRKDERSNFLLKIKNTRNYFTHLDQRYRKNSFESDDLYEVTHDLARLLRWHILQSLGLPKELLKLDANPSDMSRMQ